MANQVKFSSPIAAVTIINGDVTAPTLKALASAGQKCGSEVDGATNRDQYGDFDLFCRFALAPVAGGTVMLYLVTAVDGTNYGDGADDSTTPPSNYCVGQFPVRAVTTQQRVGLRLVPLPPFKWKAVVRNLSGQAMTNTDNENVLKYRAYNNEIQ